MLADDTNLASVFRFTVENDSMTIAERQFYEDNGYIVFRGLVPPEHISLYRKRFEDVCRGIVKIKGMNVMRDVAILDQEFAGQPSVTKLSDLIQDDAFFSYCQLPQIVKYAKCFTGPNGMTIKQQLINKPPDSGTLTSRHPLHQDGYFFSLRPFERVVGCWTALDKIPREKGCLAVVPGSHKWDLQDHDYPQWEGGVNAWYHGVKDYKPSENNRVWLEMEPGDTIFFSVLLWHGSGMNRTKDYRKAMNCHFASCETHFAESKDTVFEKLQNEVVALTKKIYKKRHGVDIDLNFKAFLLSQMRLAYGVRVNLWETNGLPEPKL